MKIYNGTAHDVCIYVNSVYDRDMRKWVGGHMVRKILRDKPLSVHVETVYLGDRDGIPIYIKSAPYASGLPYGYDMYIVSMQFAMVHGQTKEKNIYVVADTVIDKKTKKVVGCRGLQLYREQGDVR